MGLSKSHSKMKVYSDTSLHLETWKISNIQPNLTSKGTRKEEQTKPKNSRRKEIIKIRAEINEMNIKKKIKNINKQRAGSLKR